MKFEDRIIGYGRCWNEYKKDPDVLFNPDPPLGVVFTFEGFWLWLLKKYE